ncbi:MAG: ribosome maturation factor RimP [Clostridia bacterium]|nr:ribosome maturation factor RimP [Clostridia bacterium]
MKTTEICEQLCRPKVEELGFTLCDVEFQKEYGDWVLTLFIDKDGGVNIDDCELVSRAIEPILDESDPIEQTYFLSVSSLGLDRPLKKDADYQRNLGKLIQVKLYAPINGKKEHIGTLESFDAESFTLKPEKGEALRLNKKDAALVRPHIVF